MPDANLADNAVLTSAFWNTYAREQVVSIVTTSTRPSNVEGRHISDTDTGRLHRGNGVSAWDAVDVTPWVEYTPSWASGVTVGDGVYAGCAYRYVGNSIEVRGQFTLGSTSAITGDVTQTVPASATCIAFAFVPVGQVGLLDASGGTRLGPVSVTGAGTAVRLFAVDTSAAHSLVALLSATVPFTWAETDVIGWHYMAALA